jgi:hypothetical protein
MLQWPSGNAVSLTWRRSQVRVLPGALTAEWTGVRIPARFHKPLDAGSNPASALSWAAGQTVRRRSCKAEIGCASPAVHCITGLWSKRDGATLAWWQCGFDSRRVHGRTGSIRRAATPGCRRVHGARPAGMELRVRLPVGPLTEGSRIRVAGPVLKAVRPKGRKGSNPLPSALAFPKGPHGLARMVALVVACLERGASVRQWAERLGDSECAVGSTPIPAALLAR